MIPPQYSDLGKAASDLFKKGYGYGVLKCDVKTKAENGTEFSISGTKSGAAIDGSLETKLACADSGVTLKTTLNTNATVNLEAGIPSPVEGGKFTVCTAIAPNTGKVNGAIKSAFKRQYINMTMDSDLNLSGPVIQGTAVSGYEGWVAGHAFAFDTAKSALTKNNLALGYIGKDIQTLLTCNDQTNFGGSLFQKVNGDLSLGVQLGWTKGDSSATFGVATKYQIDADSSCVAKVSNNGHIGCGYTHQLKPGVKITISSLVDAKSWADANHNTGLSLEFEL